MRTAGESRIAYADTRPASTLQQCDLEFSKLQSLNRILFGPCFGFPHDVWMSCAGLRDSPFPKFLLCDERLLAQRPAAAETPGACTAERQDMRVDVRFRALTDDKERSRLVTVYINENLALLRGGPIRYRNGFMVKETRGWPLLCCRSIFWIHSFKTAPT